MVDSLKHEMFTSCDAPKPWGMYFQDTASPQMEALAELHDNIMFYLVIILFAVGWIMISVIRNYVKNKISNKYINHGTLIELIWTVTPALILILIAFPSFKLLYLMDQVTDPNLTVFAEGHQWYWSYQYPDFLSDDNEELEFYSYLVPKSNWDDAKIMMLVDKLIAHAMEGSNSSDSVSAGDSPSSGTPGNVAPGGDSESDGGDSESDGDSIPTDYNEWPLSWQVGLLEEKWANAQGALEVIGDNSLSDRQKVEHLGGPTSDSSTVEYDRDFLFAEQVKAERTLAGCNLDASPADKLYAIRADCRTVDVAFNIVYPESDSNSE